MIISVNDVRIICPVINVNITDVQIENGIEMVTDTLLKDTIGQEYLEQLENELVIPPTGHTTPNQYLIDNFLKYIISYGVWKHLVITLSYMVMPDGLRIKTSDHSGLAEKQDITFYRDYIDNFIDNKREAMNRYIRYNSSSYPLYYRDKYGDNQIENRFNFKIGKVQGSEKDTNYYGSDHGPVL